GLDTAYSEDQMKVGRKLATKLLNVSKFVLGFGAPPDGSAATEPLDTAMLARLDQVIAEGTAAFDELDYARALERTEEFFWWFCDDYVELVKSRAYTDDAAVAASARVALRTALSTLQRMFAPFIPFTTEEVWSWWNDGSIHGAPWPVADADSGAGDPALLDVVCEIVAQVRRAKTEAKVTQRASVARLLVTAPAAAHAAIEAGRSDISDAGSIQAFDIATGETVRCEIVLAPVEPVA
ncbi:MAG: valS, partial [Ilumatobacteraceae bacterium]|nr:valS [Ilumatobacteraceae bacterium]